METMVPPQQDETPDEKIKIKKRPKRKINKKGPNKKRKKEKMREKERRDNSTILLPHLCFKVAP